MHFFASAVIGGLRGTVAAVIADLRVVLRHRVVGNLRDDPSDNIGQFRSKTGNRSALGDFSADFCDSLVKVDIGGNYRACALRILTKRFSHGVLDASDTGSFQLGIDIDTDNRCIAHDDNVRAIDAGNPFCELLEVDLPLFLREKSGSIRSRVNGSVIRTLHPRNLVGLILGRG